jgi:hypothetical protein
MDSRTARRLIVAGLCIGSAVVATASSAAAARHGVTASAAPKLGHWTSLSGNSTVETGTPAIWQDSQHRAYVLWLRNVSSTEFTYEVARVAANGKPAAAVDAFSGAHWGSLSNEPTLVGQGGKPLAIYSGIRGSTGDYARGCIYGAAGTTQPWTLQPWSLSNDCVNPVGSAGEDKSGTLAAAWGAGNAVLYRLGTSPTIPATGSDSSIPLSSGDIPYKTGIVADAGGSDDFYVAYAQEFSNPASHDGYYVKDVTAGGTTMKAPGSDTDSINRLGGFTNLAIAARSGHAGVYVGYCTGSTKCSLKLWHVGASKALTVPGSPNPQNISIAAAPGGRIWVGWYDGTNNKVYITRTNTKVSKFGSVRSYSTPCFEHGLLGLSSGSSGVLDVAMQCVNNSTKLAEYSTQVEVGLHVSPSSTKVRNTSKHKITMTVTDVGNAVSGATVLFHAHKGTTNSKGTVSFTLAKHTKPGKYAATARKSQYLSAKTTVTVTK